MPQQMLDRDVVGDERQVVTEHGTGRRGELERSVLDQAHHRERREPLRAARYREDRLDRVRDPVGTVGEPVRLGQLGAARAVHAHDTREPAGLHEGIHRRLDLLHGANATKHSVGGGRSMGTRICVGVLTLVGRIVHGLGGSA